MTASSSKNQQSKVDSGTISLLYMLAEDYLKLPWVARFNVGRDMKIIDEWDIYNRTEDEIDELIFTTVVKKDLIAVFVNFIYKVD